jgi:hypothetical protein
MHPLAGRRLPEAQKHSFSAKLRQSAQDPESNDVRAGSYSHRDSMNKPIKENWTTGDISGFGFAFSLVLLGTILSAYSDQPVFWLLVGPGPIVIGLTVTAFLRHLFNVRRALTAQRRNPRTAGLGWLNVLYRKQTSQ